MSERFRAVFIPALHLDLPPFFHEYATHKEAEIALDVVANYTLFLHSNKLMSEHLNIGAIMRWDGADWVEIDGDGNEL